MSDIRMEVRRVLYDAAIRDEGGFPPDITNVADDMIAAAEPHIRVDERRKVLEKLIADSQRVVLSEAGCWTTCEPDEFNSIEEWLREHLDKLP